MSAREFSPKIKGEIIQLFSLSIFLHFKEFSASLLCLSSFLRSLSSPALQDWIHCKHFFKILRSGACFHQLHRFISHIWSKVWLLGLRQFGCQLIRFFLLETFMDILVDARAGFLLFSFETRLYYSLLEFRTVFNNDWDISNFFGSLSKFLTFENVTLYPLRVASLIFVRLLPKISFVH